MNKIKLIENELNIILPESLKSFLLANPLKDKRCKLVLKDEIIVINKFLGFDSQESISYVKRQYGDLLDYDTIPIAIAEYDDLICLYYETNDKEPKVVYLSYELALEDINESLFNVAINFDEFCKMLVTYEG
jgi:hypothetical protein